MPTKTKADKTEVKETIFKLTGQNLTLNDVYNLSSDINSRIELSPEVEKKVNDSRDLLDRLVDEGKTIYGVNTSLGGMVEYLVPEKSAKELQNNLINAVATNVGEYFSDFEVRASMLARINSLSRGKSAIQLKNLNVLVEMFNQSVIPCVPKKGSLGASGDLGPLAAIALVANGQWKARVDGKIMPGDKALAKRGIQPMDMSYKEGLALINGTSVMVGMASIIAHEAEHVIQLYDLISAISFESVATKKKPFHRAVHAQKPHKGQQECASNIYRILHDSKFINNEDHTSEEIRKQRTDDVKKLDVQIEDPYSVRCTPQILGPVKDTLKFVKQIFENELNSANDNPLVIPEEGDAFHNGHFHGQYMSMGMDYLRISLTTLCNLADRRIDRLMDKDKNKILPPFLCKENPGLRLGLMGGQFCSTSLTAENRYMSAPLSISTLPSTGGFQDIVSMGLISARKTQEVLKNTTYIIAFELLCSLQAVDICGREKLSTITEKLYKSCREVIPYFDKDIVLTDYLEDLSSHIFTDEIADIMKEAGLM